MITFLQYLTEQKLGFGEDFEHQFINALTHFSSNEEEKRASDEMLDIARKFLEKYVLHTRIEEGKKYDFIIKPEAELDKRRDYLVVDGNDIHLNEETSFNVGSTITDVTVIFNKKPTYVSLKESGICCFASIGFKKLDIESFDSPQLKSLFELCFSECNVEEIINGMKNGLATYKRNHKSKNSYVPRQMKDKPSIDVKMSNELRTLLKKCIGYGYIYIWRDKEEHTYNMFEMTEELLDRIIEEFSDNVVIEFPCKSNKNSYIRFENRLIKNIKFEMKDNHDNNDIPDQFKLTYRGLNIGEIKEN